MAWHLLSCASEAMLASSTRAAVSPRRLLEYRTLEPGFRTFGAQMSRAPISSA